MLGFGKKKDKGKDSLLPDELEDPKGKKKQDSPKEKAPAKEGAAAKPGKLKGAGKKIAGLKNLFTKKRIFLFFIILLLGGGGYAGYSFFFAQKENKPVYAKKKLEHITLPDEMLRFTFDHFLPLYQAFLAFNSEVILLDKEIQRIDDVGQKYPEQMKIADREKKVWEKSKDALLKAFSKIEKPIREIYVLYQVNPDQGKDMASEKSPELIQSAEEALAAAREQTDKLRQSQEPAPEGFLPGLMFKVKKKF